MVKDIPDLTADVAELQEDDGNEEILAPSKKRDLKRKPAKKFQRQRMNGQRVVNMSSRKQQAREALRHAMPKQGGAPPPPSRVSQGCAPIPKVVGVCQRDATEARGKHNASSHKPAIGPSVPFWRVRPHRSSKSNHRSPSRKTIQTFLCILSWL